MFNFVLGFVFFFFLFFVNNVNINLVVYIVETPAMDMEPVRLRARSNSAESWEAVNGGTTRRGVRHTWQTEPEDPEGETRNSKAKRQDSYLQAVRNHLG